MEEKIKLLNKFIKTFFKESERKTKSQNNSVGLIQYRLEKIFQEYYDKKTEFSAQEIKSAFKKRGYSILDNEDYQHPRWGKPTELTFYINVDRRILTDLKLFRTKTLPGNWSEDTKVRVTSLRNNIETFFENET